MLQIGEYMIQERFEQAGLLAEEMIAHFPQLNNVYMLVLIAGKQWMAGDRSGALVNCRRAVDVLEKKIDSVRIDEIQAAIVNERAFMPFRMAVEMAGQEGRVEEAFEYAERLRAWTLRRLLGGPRAARDTAPRALGRREEIARDHSREGTGARCGGRWASDISRE
jgi:hypothetical protein